MQSDRTIKECLTAALTIIAHTDLSSKESVMNAVDESVRDKNFNAVFNMLNEIYESMISDIK